MSIRILFVEDEALIRLCTGELLRQEGFDVVDVESADLAACVLETHDFDLLLTDVRMPGSKDGLALATHARRANPDMPVVVLTGYAENLGARVHALGPRTVVIQKPFRLEELIAAIAAVTEDRVLTECAA